MESGLLALTRTRSNPRRQALPLDTANLLNPFLAVLVCFSVNMSFRGIWS